MSEHDPSGTHAADDASTRRAERAAARRRMEQQQTWVDLQVNNAISEGKFADLPGFGKPLPDLGSAESADPDWWTKRLISREQISGVLPPALQLRKDDANLREAMDTIANEREARAFIEAFNERVRTAKWQPLGGPPMITQQRDVEAEMDAWAQRRAQRHAAAQRRIAGEQKAGRERWRWWRRSP